MRLDEELSENVGEKDAESRQKGKSLIKNEVVVINSRRAIKLVQKIEGIKQKLSEINRESKTRPKKQRNSCFIPWSYHSYWIVALTSMILS